MYTYGHEGADIEKKLKLTSPILHGGSKIPKYPVCRIPSPKTFPQSNCRSLHLGIPIENYVPK